MARDEGRIVFAPFLMPGETAQVESVSEKKDLVKARLIKVAEPSASRIEPLCSHFTRCGGCHYQHASYEFQLQEKVNILREVLRRNGRIEYDADIAVVSGEPWGYRNRIQLHCEEGRIGFHQAGSHKIRAIDQCPISSPTLNSALAALNKMKKDKRWPNFLRSVELFTNEKETLVNVLDSGDRHLSKTFFDWCAENIPGATLPGLEYKAAGEHFKVSHKSFFQVNRFLVDQLAAVVMEGAVGENVLDLYAGVGLFSIPLARKGHNVIAVETSVSSVRDLIHNAREAKVQIETDQRQSEQFLEDYKDKPDFVLADPPRVGLGKQVTKRLLELAPPRIHLVSCEPSTLARDMASFIAAGYKIESLTMVDLFPQTAHIETVAKLQKA